MLVGREDAAFHQLHFEQLPLSVTDLFGKLIEQCDYPSGQSSALRFLDEG